MGKKLSHFKIEKNIPVPPRLYNGGAVYPLRSMKTGDSFFVPCERNKRQSVQSSIGTYARRLREEKGWEFATRSDENGVRCWRIE